jgi:bifunctional non-homologous end joining protein LigD
LARLSGARKARFPDFIEFCDPTLRELAPRGANWLYEIKADGCRAQIHLQGGKAKVYSRNGLDWTEEFSTIAQAAAELGSRNAVLDGEAVVYGATGLPDF